MVFPDAVLLGAGLAIAINAVKGGADAGQAGDLMVLGMGAGPALCLSYLSGRGRSGRSRWRTVGRPGWRHVGPDSLPRLALVASFPPGAFPGCLLVATDMSCGRDLEVYQEPNFCSVPCSSRAMRARADS